MTDFSEEAYLEAADDDAAPTCPEHGAPNVEGDCAWCDRADQAAAMDFDGEDDER